MKKEEKTLVINGSPRKDGHCAAVTEYIKKYTVCEVINCCFEDIAHCTGCDACKNGKCVINDKMSDIYEKIKSADRIIFVSPLYFSMLTGALLTLASRFQYFYHHPVKNTKRGAVILLGGGSTKDTKKAFSTAKIILRYVGVNNPEEAAFVGTDIKKPLEDAAFKNKIDGMIGG
ncbi:MAG: flavodoxin family protein [Firmicutes bacterium]|nr:flavodoxin family protein [Bacillota bacterium]